MALVIVRTADADMGEAVVRRSMRLHLFVNDRFPSRLDTLASYLEPTTGGYAPIELGAKGWVRRTDGVMEYPPQRWRFNAAVGLIYGFFVTVEGKLWWVERFQDGPKLAANPGDRMAVGLEYELQAEISG